MTHVHGWLLICFSSNDKYTQYTIMQNYYMIHLAWHANSMSTIFKSSALYISPVKSTQSTVANMHSRDLLGKQSHHSDMRDCLHAYTLYRVWCLTYFYRHGEEDDFVLLSVEGLQQFLKRLHLPAVLCTRQSHKGGFTGHLRELWMLPKHFLTNSRCLQLKNACK